LLLTTRETRYKVFTVQAGTPMTVKEMGSPWKRGELFISSAGWLLRMGIFVRGLIVLFWTPL
jgi:hypothetical protein